MRKYGLLLVVAISAFMFSAISCGASNNTVPANNEPAVPVVAKSTITFTNNSSATLSALDISDGNEDSQWQEVDLLNGAVIAPNSSIEIEKSAFTGSSSGVYDIALEGDDDKMYFKLQIEVSSTDSLTFAADDGMDLSE